MTGRRPYLSTTDTLAAVACPLCKASIDQWCVYVVPVVEPGHSPPGDYNSRLRRAGTRMKILHQDRYLAARHVLGYGWTYSRFTRPGPVKLTAQQAYRAYDVVEYQALRAWYRDNIHLLLRA